MKRNSIIKSIMVFLISFVWIIQGITSPIVALEEPVSENTIVENQDGTEQQDENGNQNEIDVTDNSQDQETAEQTVIENKEDELTKEDSDIQVESKEQNTNAAIPGDSSLVEYFYVGSPYLTTPATQQFILSFGTGAEGITSVKLEYQKDGEEELSLDVARQQSNLYVFERSFTEAESGTYKVNGFTYVIDNQTYEVSFSDLEMDIRFGVNQEYEGYGTAEGYTVDANGNEVQEEAIDTQGLSEAEIDTSVVTLDGSNADQTEALVEDALQNNALPSVQSRSRSNSITTYSETNPLVICIDPGHGGNDSGTIIVNGAYEKNYNLKIAQYLKAELEQYKNVKVVMTRTGDTNPSLQQRAQIAADAGATALVSIHLNATGWGTQSTIAGAEVYYPSSNYNAATSTTGKNLAQNILNQLVGLGIQNRGIKVKYVYNTETGQPAHDPAYDYPDGSVGDYYGVIRYSKLVGVSGIIVEHCMADNWNDFNKFLSSDAKLKQLGVADATGIAKAFGLSKISRNDLDTLASQNKSVLADGTYFIQSALSSNYVADVKSAGTANYVNVQLYKKNNTDAQGWKVTHDSKGYVTFTNVNSGKVLDVNAAKAANYQNVQQYASNGTYAQKWVVVKDGSSYKIISALNQNYVLDLNAAKAVNSQNIQIYQSNNTKAQRWTFAKYQTVRQRLDSSASQNKSVLANGTYYIQSALSSNYVADVKSAGTANYVNVQLYKKNNT
ncbi:N-acetylmuramoyl-L-alanine amidase, partial [Faecalicoccus acidiformans]|uniref:N-acetylmuramoyl-L-alanine amidase n=1 Tax=Faecalicoccus acidiformans TaxID=915173 RepID=UPI002355B0F9